MNVIPLHNYPSMAVFQESSVLEKPKNHKSIVVPTQESLDAVRLYPTILRTILYLRPRSERFVISI